MNCEIVRWDTYYHHVSGVLSKEENSFSCNFVLIKIISYYIIKMPWMHFWIYNAKKLRHYDYYYELLLSTNENFTTFLHLMMEVFMSFLNVALMYIKLLHETSNYYFKEIHYKNVILSSFLFTFYCCFFR